MKCCRTCVLYDLDTAINPATGRVRRNGVAQCNWKLTVPLPASAIGYFGSAPGVKTRWMTPGDGTTCECHVPRPKEQKQ